MGDTGSLALGGGVAALALLTHTELLLVIIGGIFAYGEFNELTRSDEPVIQNVSKEKAVSKFEFINKFILPNEIVIISAICIVPISLTLFLLTLFCLIHIMCYN